jgi:hypothetical protein
LNILFESKLRCHAREVQAISKEHTIATITFSLSSASQIFVGGCDTINPSSNSACEVAPCIEAHSKPSVTPSGNITPALQANTGKDASIYMYMARNQRMNNISSLSCVHLCDSRLYECTVLLTEKKSPPRVVVRSNLYGLICDLERSVHDDGMDFACVYA